MDPVVNRPISIFQARNGIKNQAVKTNREGNFKEVFTDALNKVNNAQVDSQVATQKLARGENIDLHDVMITAQKASILLQTTVEVRNKVVEAYQEVMRMQV
ncbi:MAG: flagellar hook-basal body complex protein FliE [Bacillaceae bacterium]|nr:flagellar hook-basal body complex protein FliE [Bacillaceae bacterium]